MIKNKFLLTILGLIFLFYACNKEDEFKSFKQQELVYDNHLSKVEMDNFLSDDYVYSQNEQLLPNRLRENSRDTKSFVSAFKKYLETEKKKAKIIDTKYGNIVWDRADVATNDSFAIFPVVDKKGGSVKYLLFVAINKDEYEIVPRTRKDAIKNKSLKELKENFEINHFPREYAAGAFLQFDKLLFDYVDCEMVDVLKKETQFVNDRDNNRECTYIPNYTTYELWSYTYNSYYQTPWELLATYNVITSYTFYCYGLNTGTEIGGTGNYGPTAGVSPPLCAVDPCNLLCPCTGGFSATADCDRCKPKCTSGCPCNTPSSSFQIINQIFRPTGFLVDIFGNIIDFPSQPYSLNLEINFDSCPEFDATYIYHRNGAEADNWDFNDFVHDPVFGSVKHYPDVRKVTRNFNAWGNYTATYTGIVLGTFSVQVSPKLSYENNISILGKKISNDWQILNNQLFSYY